MSESSNTFINRILNGKNPQNACEESSIITGRGGEGCWAPLFPYPYRHVYRKQYLSYCSARELKGNRLHLELLYFFLYLIVLFRVHKAWNYGFWMIIPSGMLGNFGDILCKLRPRASPFSSFGFDLPSSRCSGKKLLTHSFSGLLLHRYIYIPIHK